jgi:hypothetical protein
MELFQLRKMLRKLPPQLVNPDGMLLPIVILEQNPIHGGPNLFYSEHKSQQEGGQKVNMLRKVEHEAPKRVFLLLNGGVMLLKYSFASFRPKIMLLTNVL